MTDRATARAAKDLLRAELAPLGGVGGIGIGRREGSYVLTVNVTVDELVPQVPHSVEGVPVEVRVVGAIRPLVPAEGRPDRSGDGGRGTTDGEPAAGRGADRAGDGRTTGPTTVGPAADRLARDADRLTSGRAAALPEALPPGPAHEALPVGPGRRGGPATGR